MNYEQKYKDALERAKKELLSCGSTDCDAARQIYRFFPELKESEDELTWLTKYIEEEAYNLSIDIRDEEDRIKLKNLKRSLAWLEKQSCQKYEDALKWAKSIYPSTFGADREDLEHFFPELKESEDEKIKNWLIGYFHQYKEDGMEEYANGLKVESIIAWLEKQEPVDTNKLAEDILRGAAITLITWIDYNAFEGSMCLSNMECKDIEDALVSGDWNKIYAYMKKKLEKQSEQKPFDYENATIIQKDFAPKIELNTEESAWSDEDEKK